MPKPRDTERLIGNIITNALQLHKYSHDSNSSKVIDKILKWAYHFAELYRKNNTTLSGFGNPYNRYSRFGNNLGIIKNGY